MLLWCTDCSIDFMWRLVGTRPHKHEGKVKSRHLRQALAHWKRVPTLARTPHPLRLPSTYTMLVESDVQHGMRSILP